MGNINRVGSQQPQPIDDNNVARRNDAPRPVREDRFARGLSNDKALAPTSLKPTKDERGNVAARQYLNDEAWARQRTVEELKTLVQAVQAGATDAWQLTDLIFYARHPEMMGVPLTKEHQALLDEWNAISALLVHPVLNEVGDLIGANVAGGEVGGAAEIGTAFERAMRPADGAGGAKNARFDNIIVRSVEWCPGLSPAILKSLLAQESNFNTSVINQYGYAGIAQFGREAAREVGLQVGVAGSQSDERLNPAKAIPGAARLLNIKAQRLGEMAFSRYGQPNGAEFWKFVLAAYNGGEGTVTLAMGNAYRTGMATARAKGLVGTEAVSFARNYASKWENLKAGGLESPLGRAAARYFPALAASKYQEIGNYPTAIVERARRTRI
ncbi:MAG TPA: transglycosylase SLT domain-containing protein [Pyrinomonadaceae bacterium]